MTLPVSPWEAILGKFLAAWAFIGLALVLTFPMWITVNILGRPDNGVILASYLGSFLTAGAFLAIGSCISALTKNQVIAFIVAAAVCFLLVMSGLEMVLNVFRAWAPPFLIAAISSLSFLTHFEDFTKGIFSLPALVFYASVIGFALFANKIILDQRKAARGCKPCIRPSTSSSCRQGPPGQRGQVRGQARHAQAAWGGLALAAITFLAVNLFASTTFRGVKMDLTRDGLYTISDGTRKALKAIDEPIDVRVYFSKRLGRTRARLCQEFRARALAAGALSRHLRRQAAGELPRSRAVLDAEDRAVAAGLRGIRLNQEGDQGYFGLVGTNATDNEASIGFFAADRERFLEYDVTKLVYTLANPRSA
jgi:hypothetical protein